MEELSRFDIAEFNGIAMVVIESELLPADPAVVVIPLLSDYPAVKYLNPTIDLDGQRLVLATRLIGAVHRGSVQRVSSAAAQGDLITRAVDVLMGGV